MSTITLEMPAEVIKKAEDMFESNGMSYSQFLQDVTVRAIMDFTKPEDLPIPCIDDLTEEELDTMLQEAFDEIDAGHYYTSEEIMERINQYGAGL